LLHQAHSLGVRDRLLELPLDFVAVAHQRAVEEFELAPAPGFIVAVEQAPGVEEQLERRERALLEELGVNLGLE